MADNSSKITNIEEIQNEGARTVTVDGVTVSRDFAELRKRKQELTQTDDALAKQRPRISTVNIGKAY